MTNDQGALTRRRALVLGAATAASAALPAPVVAAVLPEGAAALPIGPPQGPFMITRRDKAFRDGLSPHFRNKEGWLWRRWRQYQDRVAEYRDVPDDNSVNFARWYLGMWVRSLAKHVPVTESDRAVLAFTERMADELLADFPEVPWQEREHGQLIEARAWLRAGGIAPEHWNAISP